MAFEAFQKRKRLCMNLIDGIMEGYPKSKQKLIEDTEIETDEAAGFDINQYKWTFPNSLSAAIFVDASCDLVGNGTKYSGGSKQYQLD